ELEKHLALLRRSGVIRAFSEQRIGAGEDWQAAMARGFAAARVILHLVSADFLALDDARWNAEVKRALERHRAGSAHVIPVIVRACDLSLAPFAELTLLPARGAPIKSALDRDVAWAEVVAGLREVLAKLHAKPTPVYTDAGTQALCEQIERVRARRH